MAPKRKAATAEGKICTKTNFIRFAIYILSLWGVFWIGCTAHIVRNSMELTPTFELKLPRKSTTTTTTRKKEVDSVVEQKAPIIPPKQVVAKEDPRSNNAVAEAPIVQFMNRQHGGKNPKYDSIPSGYNIFKRDNFRYEEDNIPVFYNLFIKDTSDYVRVRHLVEEQFRKFESIHKPIYVNNIGVPLDFNYGDETTGSLNTTENPVELLGNYESASESVTLKHIWSYCQETENENQKVAYLHSKGSYTATVENGRLRRFITTGALSMECANMPKDMCNICASRFSPAPHPHTSGNMWLARCDYIKQLKDPDTFEQAMDSLGYTGGERYLACDGRGRYSAEHWVLSHPNVKPCDLFKDPRFTWNYDGIPKVGEFRKNLELAKFPRFELGLYLKTKIQVCPFRGTSLSFRINEYKGLYNMEPPADWWGHGFFKDDAEWWPYRDTTWFELPEFARQEIIKMGFNHHLWDAQKRPHSLWGKKWDDMSVDHRKTLEETFLFDRQIWDNQIKNQLRDLKRIDDSIKVFEPNTSFDRCTATNATRKEIQPWYIRTKENLKKPLQDYVFEHETKPTERKRLLIIAAVPRDWTHILTLWTELECFTDPVDHVLISAPTWGKAYVEHVMKLAMKYIPHFVNGQVTMEVKYFLNNRYDVGLWCDAYKSLETPQSYDEYGLINDSVFALRKFSAIFDNLEHQKLQMTSLAYSFTYKWNVDYGPEEFWVESVFRGFDKQGINTFNVHSCVAEDDPMFCPEEKDNKACIINNFEHDLAKQFPCDKVQGLYPTDSPELLKPQELSQLTWIKNTRYWRMLVDHMGFPIAKANEPDMTGGWYTLRESLVAWVNDPMLKTCTEHIMPKLEELFEGLDFDKAKAFHKQKWGQLSPEMQQMARETLGYDLETWDSGTASAELAGKTWNQLEQSHRSAIEVFECSKLMYEKKACRVF